MGILDLFKSFMGGGGLEGAKITGAFSKVIGFTSLVAFVFAFAKLCHAGYLFSEGRASEGKNAIFGAFIAGGAGVITGFLFSLWGVNPLGGI